MQTFKYYAVVTSDSENDCYLVRFPDLKNVLTDGETLLEAVKHVEEIFERMLEVMINYNRQFNPPSPVSTLKIEEGELIFIEVHVTHKGTDGDFKQETPYKVILTDITYIFYGNGKRAYLSIIIVGSTNEVLAHQLYENMKLDILLGTLKKLRKNCRVRLAKDAFIHSDQGSHYTSPTYQKQVKRYEVRSVNVL